MTRVEKYKDYRSRLISADDKVMESTSNKIVEKDDKANPQIFQTTSQLPISEVMMKLEEDESPSLKKTLSEKKKAAIRKYVLFGLIMALLVAALVIFGIYAFSH